MLLNNIICPIGKHKTGLNSNLSKKLTLRTSSGAVHAFASAKVEVCRTFYAHASLCQYNFRLISYKILKEREFIRSLQPDSTCNKTRINTLLM